MPRTAAKNVDPVRNYGCSKALLKKDGYFLSECSQRICSSLSSPVRYLTILERRT